MIRRLFAALVFTGLSSVALASSCPLLMGEIDTALEDPVVEQRLSEDQLTQVLELREQGEAAHRAGDHTESVEALRQAKEILGIS